MQERGIIGCWLLINYKNIIIRHLRLLELSGIWFGCYTMKEPLKISFSGSVIPLLFIPLLFLSFFLRCSHGYVPNTLLAWAISPGRQWGTIWSLLQKKWCVLFIFPVHGIPSFISHWHLPPVLAVRVEPVWNPRALQKWTERDFTSGLGLEKSSFQEFVGKVIGVGIVQVQLDGALSTTCLERGEKLAV